MAFWSDTFLNKMRSEWLRRLVKVQYYSGGKWYDAKITEKSISGNTLIIYSQTTDSLDLTITAVRIVDTSGDVAGQISENIFKDASHGMLTRWEFPLFELTDEAEAQIVEEYNNKHKS